MSKIESPRFSSLLRRYLGMVGQASVADELSPEISPGIQLEGERPEWEFLKGAKLMSAPLNVTGAAGTTSAFRFRNPSTSGVIAIFGGRPNEAMCELSMDAQAGATAAVQFQSRADSGVNLTATLAGIPRDTRYTNVAANTSALIGSQTNNLVGAAGDIFHGGLSTNLGIIPVYFRFTFVLTPGNELNIVFPVANTSTRGGILWLEKRIDQLEVS